MSTIIVFLSLFTFPILRDSKINSNTHSKGNEWFSDAVLYQPVHWNLYVHCLRRKQLYWKTEVGFLVWGPSIDMVCCENVSRRARNENLKRAPDDSNTHKIAELVLDHFLGGGQFYFLLSIFPKAYLLLICKRRAITTSLYVDSLFTESYKAPEKKITQETLPQVLWIMTSAWAGLLPSITITPSPKVPWLSKAWATNFQTSWQGGTTRYTVIAWELISCE